MKSTNVISLLQLPVKLQQLSLLLLVQNEIDTLTFGGLLGHSVREDIMNIRQLQISLIGQIEKVGEGQVAHRHQVANRLHNIPARIVKSAVEDTAKLAKDD